MRKSMKKMLAIATAALLSVGTLSLGACAPEIKAAGGMPTNYDGEAASNGGFVVSVGDYYYFINGVETYTSDNTYGTPVKGALMRVKKSDVKSGDPAKTEMVVPSLMVAGDYTAGLFVYGDRVYYATPTNDRNTNGVVENSYLDFKSAKLDGSDIKSHLRLESNTTVYRYVQTQKDGPVYLMYIEGSSSPYTGHSVNTETGADTVLFKDATGYLFDAHDVENPEIYYTMGVTYKPDSDADEPQPYNQIYRVKADATESPYTYEWDADWIKENNDGEEPYTNLGEIVLDGRGSAQAPDETETTDKKLELDTRFTHSKLTKKDLVAPVGYTYALRSYQDGALYYTQTEAGSSSRGGDLFYLPESKLTAEWDSGEGANTGTVLADKVAVSTYAESKATSTAYFFTEGTGDALTHHYLYVSNNRLFHAVADEEGFIESGKDICISNDVSSATILSIDAQSDPTYHYVYFTRTNGSGTSVERAVYNGDASKYQNLSYTDESGNLVSNAPYAPQKVLNIQHATGWYQCEIVDGLVFYADAESFGGTSYNYLSVVDLKGADGKLLNNEELDTTLNEKYDSIVNTTDKEKGLYAKLNDVFGDSDLSDAIKYYFYTGETESFYANIKEAENNGQENTSLYSEDEQEAFKKYAENGEFALSGKTVFSADDYKDYRTYSAFRSKLGVWNDADETAYEDYWKQSGLKHYTPPEETESEGLAWWAWLLISLAIAVAVVAAACGTFVFIKMRGKKEQPKQEKPKVITSDDRNIDVYSDDVEPDVPEEAAAEETAEPEAAEEEVSEETSEEPAESAEETSEEAPAEEPSEEPAPEEKPDEE